MMRTSTHGIFASAGVTALALLVGCQVASTTSQSALPTQSGAIVVTVSPGSSSVQTGAAVQFSASVQGDTANKGVTWSIQSSPGCNCGTIDSTGRYLAPSTSHTAPGVIIEATSVSDPTKSGTGIVYVAPPPGSNGGISVGKTSGRFSVTGNMATARAGHTATLLLDGSVLVAGAGQLDIDDLLVSFPFSETLQSSGQVMTTENLSTPREFHTATLLQNGKVLITGGNVFTGYPTRLLSSASAELYDPSVGQFVAIGDMSVARTGHTASLWADGRVLIFGGTSSSTPSAEIYDSSVGTFAPLPNPVFSRSGHTATVLPSGKILFTGGRDTSGTLATAEMYDPATNSFTAVGSMEEPRTHHTATLLPNGKVLIAGGGIGSVLGFGADLGISPQQTVGSPSHTAELFDPQTGTFAPAGTMNAGRSSHTATLLPDGTVLLCGGSVGWFNPNGYVSDNTAEMYDPAIGSFKDAGTMNIGKFWHTATLLRDGTVVLLGGIDRDLQSNVMEAFK